jgi:hypothetical protein
MKFFNRIPKTMKTTRSNIIYDLRFTIYERLLATPLVVLALLLLGLAPSAHAAGPPEAMTFQGFLVDPNGNPLATNNPANYPVIFRIYAAPSGGAPLWSEQQIVTVDKGNFSVILSEGTAVSGELKPLLSTVLAASGADRYVQITVTVNGSPLDMLPRLRLLPSPYAFLSTSANQLVTPNGAAVVTYANSRVEVAGNLFASGNILGNGSGLTGLTATQVPSLDAGKITTGTFADARIPTTVARLSGDNAFQGNVTVNGRLSLNGGVQARGGPPGGLGVNNNGYAFSGNGGDNDSGLFSSADGQVELYTQSEERMRVDPFGNVGIGITAPTAKLEVNGGIKVRDSNVLEFGAGVAGKEPNAGKIGYGAFTPNTLDIVGAGATPATRKVKITAEGGTDFVGPVSFNGDRPFHFGNTFAFDGNGHNGAVSNVTSFSSSQHHVVVVGADAKNGEIYQARALVNPSGNWFFHAYIRDNNGSPLTWRVFYMLVPRALVTTNSTTPAFIP